MNKKNLKTAPERLEWWVNEHYPVKADFARAIDVNPTSLSRYTGKGKNKSIFSNKYRKKLIAIGLNYEWYVNGEGEPDVATAISDNMVKEESNVYVTTIPNGLFVKFVNVLANAGEGYNFDDEPEMLMNIQRNYDPKTHIAMKIKGDSMSPDITDMSTIIVDTTREARPNDIVLAVVDGIAYCKRLIIDGGKKKLVSDNKKYNSFTINGVNNVEIKGVVVEAYKKWH